MYYSKSTGGFYSEAIHGSRKILVGAPGWVHPQIEVTDPEWIAAEHPENTPVPMLSIPDPEAIPETIEIDNSDCKIPVDAVEITAAAHAELLAGESQGKIIFADLDGRPMLADPPPLTGNALVLSQIAALEATVTVRRIREAVIGADGGWLAAINASIVSLRKSLT